MTMFPVYAANFELHPKAGEAFEHLSPLLGGLKRIDFALRVDDPSVNQGQMASDFDEQLEKTLLARGAKPFSLRLPAEIPQKFDFAFTFGARRVAVEIEKTDREKIMRDILKCHMYLHSGADFAVVGLPKNYPHSHGVWNLFDFGMERFDECRTYGFRTADKLDRILLLGYEQFAAATDKPLNKATRQEMRSEANIQLRRA